MKGREIEPGWLPGTVQHGKWEENIKTSRESHELVCTGVADVMKILGLCHRQVVLRPRESPQRFCVHLTLWYAGFSGNHKVKLSLFVLGCAILCPKKHLHPFGPMYVIPKQQSSSALLAFLSAFRSRTLFHVVMHMPFTTGEYQARSVKERKLDTLDIWRLLFGDEISS